MTPSPCDPASLSKIPLFGVSIDEIVSAFSDPLPGFKPFHATILAKWLYKHREFEFDRMTDLPKRMRGFLTDRAVPGFLRIDQRVQSLDGTTKFRFQLEDGYRIETVHIPEPRRRTLCVSSQVGCARGCRFCFTATLKLKRNLSAHEIVGQLMTVERELPPEEQVTNIVFMGMGEPFDNWTEVSRAISLFEDHRGLDRSRRRICVSTVGHVPGIREASTPNARFRLAVSLHAATDELRSRLMPVNDLFPLGELMPSLAEFAHVTRDRVTFEYTLIRGVNDSMEDARALHRLIASIPSKVNLIPFNPFPGSSFERSPPERIKAFSDFLFMKGHVAPVRRTRGDDILGACGQLALDGERPKIAV